MSATGFTLLAAPLLPMWQIAALAALTLALIAALWWLRRNTLAATARLAAATLLLLALLNPQLQKEKRQPLDDIAVVLLDRSASQRIDQRAERTTAAAQRLRTMLDALPNLQVRIATVPADDGRQGTRLVAALGKALADVPPERFAGALIVTDGRVHDMPKQPNRALPAGYAGPLHMLITGRKNERDRRVIVEQAARYGIVGKQQTVRFRIRQQGGKVDARVAVTIRVNGESWGEYRIRPNAPVSLQLPIARAGQNVTEIIAAPMKGGEISLANNHAVILTRGVRDRLRVLLISGEPHPGERAWRNLLKADPGVDLVHFTILRPPEKQDGTPVRELALIAFPTHELFVEKLSSFDLVIFDRYQRRAILPSAYMGNLVDYVNNGGAVLFTAGPEFAGDYSLANSPLAGILPARPRGKVVTTPYRARLTKDGRRHPVTRGLRPAADDAKRPPWGRWFRLVAARPEQGARVLMHGPGGAPLLVLQRKGKGRAAVLLSDHIWLWARKVDGGGPHVELMRRIAHWLMKEPDLEEEALSGKAVNGDLVITRRTMGEKAPPLHITGPDGKTMTLPLRRVAPGLFSARIRKARPGLYRLRNGQLAHIAAMGDPGNLETRDLTATDAILRPLAEATGGALKWIAAGAGPRVRLPRLARVDVGRATHGGGWLGLVRRDVSRLVAVEHTPLFATIWALVVALLLLGLAWRLEGR